MLPKIHSAFSCKHSRQAGMFILLLCLLCGGLWSLWLGQDVSFDLLNYHLYLPYAFLHGRFGQDLIAAGATHTFFNPLADIPYYLLFVHLNDWPRLTAFLQGLWYGLFLFFAWKTVALLFPHSRSAHVKLLRLSTFLLGVTGIAAATQAGMSTNEVMLGALLLAALYLLLYKHPSDSRAPYYWAWAAFVCCAATGLKYTCAPVCAGLGAAGLYLWARYQRRGKVLFLCTVCGAAGFLLTAGYFLWRNWDWMGNPFFPYFNAFFHSPYFVSENLSNSSAVPASFSEVLLLPFTQLATVPEYAVDCRVTLGYVSVVILALWALFWRGKKLNARFTALWLIFLVAYIAWAIFFASMRYTAILEFVGAALTVYVLYCVFSSVTSSALAAVLCVVVCFQPIPDWGRQGFLKQNQIFSNLPSIENNALVLLGGHVSFLVPFFNPKAQYVGGIWFRPQEHPDKTERQLFSVNRLQPADYRHHFDPLIRQKVCEHDGPLYILGPWTDMMWQPVTWQRYGVLPDEAPESCRFFNSSISIQWKGFVLCPARKNCR